jgi:hypothetical protein
VKDCLKKRNALASKKFVKNVSEKRKIFVKNTSATVELAERELNFFVMLKKTAMTSRLAMLKKPNIVLEDKNVENTLFHQNVLNVFLNSVDLKKENATKRILQNALKNGCADTANARASKSAMEISIV